MARYRYGGEAGRYFIRGSRKKTSCNFIAFRKLEVSSIPPKPPFFLSLFFFYFFFFFPFSMERSCSKRTCGMIKYVHQILFHHEQVYIQIDIRGWVTVYVLSFTLYLELLAAAFFRKLTARGIEQFDGRNLTRYLIL